MDEWYWKRLEDSFELNDNGTTSEYERGFIDGWNKLVRIHKSIVISMKKLFETE